MLYKYLFGSFIYKASIKIYFLHTLNVRGTYIKKSSVRLRSASDHTLLELVSWLVQKQKRYRLVRRDASTPKDMDIFGSAS